MAIIGIIITNPDGNSSPVIVVEPNSDSLIKVNPDATGDGVNSFTVVENVPIVNNVTASYKTEVDVSADNSKTVYIGDSPVQMRATDTHIQWRNVKNSVWANLIALADFMGGAGADGREIELSSNATHLLWRYVGDAEWINLIAISDFYVQSDWNQENPLSPEYIHHKPTIPTTDDFGVLTVTGDGVDNADPANPVLIFPDLSSYLKKVNWGDILGTLSEQTDLQAELDKFVTLATGQTVTGVKIFKNTVGFYLQQASASNPATLRIGPPRDAVDASHAHVLRPAESLSASRTWDLPDKSGTIALTDDIPTAIDGREVEFQVSATHIQWRYVGESVWIDLIALSELEGAPGQDGEDGAPGSDGDDGITPHIGANGNWYIGLTDTGVQAEGQDGADGADGNDGVGIASITLISTVGLVKTYRITFTNATTFDYVVTDGSDGEDGRPGTPGADGDDGREIELRTSLTHIQWRYVGDATWINLIALSTLKGDQGAPGADGDDGREIEIAIVEDPFAGGDYIKWRYVGTSSWTTLISVAAITGPAGAPGADGADGAPGEDGADGTSTYYTTHTLALSGIVPENTYFPGFTIDRILVSGSYVENQRIIRVAGRTLSGSVGIKVYRKLHGQTTGAQILPSIGVYTIQNTGNTFDVNYSLSHNNYIYFFIPLGYVNLGEDLSVTITIEHTLTSGGGGLGT